MTELIIGVALGAVGMYAKDKFLGNSETNKLNAKKRELDELYTENDKIRKRNKDLTRQVEDLQLENIKLQKRIDDMDDSHNVLEDDLYKIKGELKKLRIQNDELYKKLQEYKSACESYELELSRLK
jgi:chromosome segregation ATPase